MQDPPLPEPAPATDTTSRSSWWWVPGAITVITIASVIIVTISQLHPGMLFTDTTTTGGDTGADIAMPKYLETLLSHGHLTGWYPGWYDGMPLYTFYFTLPDALIAIAGWIIPYDVAFKLGTILGSVMLPVAPGPVAGSSGYAPRSRPSWRPPRCPSSSTTRSPSTAATCLHAGGGVLVLLQPVAGRAVPRFFACAVREGRYRGWAAVVLAGCVLSHIVPGLYALGARWS